MRMRTFLVALTVCLSIVSIVGFTPSCSVTHSRLKVATPLASGVPWKGSLDRGIVRPYISVLDETPSGSQEHIAEVKPNPYVAIINLFGIFEIFRYFFNKNSITFPASLGGCGALLTTFLLAPIGDDLYNQFAPGAAVLAKWLPVFFVPSLISLPLANSVGSTIELLKIGAVIIAGFFFTLLTTAASVLVVRKSQGRMAEAPPAASAKDGLVTPIQAPNPFTGELALALNVSSFTAGLLTILSKRVASSTISNPLTTAFMLFATLNTFVFGVRLPKNFTKVVHPLVTCTSLTWLSIWLVGKLSGESFRSMLVSYAAAGGAGKILLGFLGPAVISLACQMYDRRKLMKENISEVAAAILVSSFGGLFGTALAVRMLAIGNPSLRLALLSRNITSPLAMAIAGILGADVSLAVSMVVITGLIGANFGAGVLDAIGIKDAVARGLGIGAAAHGLGTAAFANEQDAFPFAAIAMALTASTCTVLVSVPIFKNAIMKLALGW